MTQAEFALWLIAYVTACALAGWFLGALFVRHLRRNRMRAHGFNVVRHG